MSWSHPPPTPQVQGREDEVRAALVAADSDSSGRLDEAQLERALEAAGLKFTRHQLIALRRRADRERCGAVASEEVLQLLGMS